MQKQGPLGGLSSSSRLPANQNKPPQSLCFDSSDSILSHQHSLSVSRSTHCLSACIIPLKYIFVEAINQAMVGFLLITMTKLVRIGVITFRVHSSCWTCMHYLEHCVSLHVFHQAGSSAMKPQVSPQHHSFSSPSQLHPVRLWGALRVDHRECPLLSIVK